MKKLNLVFILNEKMCLACLEYDGITMEIVTFLWLLANYMEVLL